MRYTNIPSSIGIDLVGFKYELGSDREPDGRFGTSHLMEHLAFDALKDLYPVMNRYGISYNAYTDNDRIVFHFTGLSEHVKRTSIESFKKVTSCSHIWTRERFDAEKEIVLQEYGDAFNDQISGFILNILRQKYGYFGTIGRRRDIEAFTYEQSIEFLQKFAAPSLVCETGSNQVEDHLPRVEYTDAEGTPCRVVCGDYDVEVEEIPKENKTLVGLIGNKPLSLDVKNQLGLVMACLNDGFESPFYQEIREKHSLSYFSSGSSIGIHDKHVPIFFACTSNERGNELRDVYHGLFSGDIRRFLTKERFDICYDGATASMKMERLVPYHFAMASVLGKDRHAGLESFTYEQAVELAESVLNLDNLEFIAY
jgi:secreted Zn-dependent insulinase-like peptidase